MPKNYRKATDRETLGTSLRGYVNITYGGLVKKFGKPHYTNADKVQAGWDFKFKDGTVLTIYDWKNYNKPVSDVKKWNIGGRGNVIKHAKILFPRNNVRSAY